MKKLLVAALMTLVFSHAAFTQAAAYGGGTGTALSPYEIWTPQQMNTIGVNPADWDKHFVLMDNIDMSIYTGTQYNIIGNATTPFRGTFDGNNHKISNLTYATTETVENVGLFGCTKGATIQNLGVENVLISSHGNDIGGLVGQNAGSLTDCYATGLVNGTGSVGGLVGYNSGMLTSCYATGSVSGTDFSVGGLVGFNVAGSLTACYATGSVSGTDSVGGLVGENEYGSSITSCYATGSVSGTDFSVGGLVGFNVGGTLNVCYATGSVSGTDCVGGLVGWNESGSIAASYATGSVSGTECVGGLVGVNAGVPLTACFATGSVNGTDSVGGLVGQNAGSLTDCYATGLVNGTDSVGGLVGDNEYGTLTACFWDIETSSQSDGVGLGSSSGATGLDTAEMMTLSTFTDVGWDFSETDGDPADWMMLREGEDYPRLAWQTIYPGDIAGLYGVDMTDLTVVIDNWLRQDCPTECEQADIDSSGTVDLADLSLLAVDWMKQ